MGLFKKKLSDEELIQKNIAAQQAEAQAVNDVGNKEDNGLGDSKLGVEITKLKAQLEGLNEQRKATNERFSRNSEEVGELRGMIIETNKAVSRIEAASTKAIDLVESVKPEELMMEVRKLDSKIEALKANLESNETMSSDIMKEVKGMRRKMDFYKGVEQIAKMNEEVKKELIDIKKTESIIERHSNKVESIFIEVEKKYSELDKFTDVTKDLKREFEKIQDDTNKLRVKVQNSAEKKEVVSLIAKFNDFEKHTSNLINLLDQKSKSTMDEIHKTSEKIQKDVDEKVNSAIKRLNLAVEEKSEEDSKVEIPKKQKPNIFGFLKKNETNENKEENLEKPQENKETENKGSATANLENSKDSKEN